MTERIAVVSWLAVIVGFPRSGLTTTYLRVGCSPTWILPPGNVTVCQLSISEITRSQFFRPSRIISPSQAARNDRDAKGPNRVAFTNALFGEKDADSVADWFMISTWLRNRHTGFGLPVEREFAPGLAYRFSLYPGSAQSPPIRCSYKTERHPSRSPL